MVFFSKATANTNRATFIRNILKHVAQAKDVPFGGSEDKIERLPYFRGQKPHFWAENLENFDVFGHWFNMGPLNR